MSVLRSIPVVPLCLAALALVAAPAFGQDAKPADPPASSQPESAKAYALMKTSHGDMVIELDREKAPISVKNFLAYIEAKSYDGTIFHRVIPTFMIQGGGFTPDFRKVTTTPPIKNEWQNGLSNARGSLAMARTNVVDSATNQFFINVVDNQRLDGAPGRPGYAVFGKVIKGMDVVDAIRNVPTGTNMQSRMQNVPVTSVVITSVRQISEEEALAEPKDDASGEDGATSKPDN